jgi:hypothetical protein
MKVYMLLDPHVPMLKGWVGPSSFPRIMSLKVVFQICFGSIKMMGTWGVLIILIEPKHIWNTTFRLIILGKLDGPTHPFNIGTCGSNNI